VIIFVDITSSNRQECISLSVSENQKNFVAANSDSLEEAAQNQGMRPAGISNDGKLIGFAMYSNSSNSNKSWIIRFMIDKSYQRKGYGKEALSKLIQLLFEKYSASDIRLCVEPENIIAIKFYENFGFQPTGEKWDNELIYELKVKR
jgi:diamine N-acetyltransferase